VQRLIEVVYAEKQEETIAGPGAVRADKGWMLVGTPLVHGEQDRLIHVKDLAKVVVGRFRRRQPEE
jgi:hypothetical protein